MKVLFLSGIDIKNASFMYNRIKEYLKQELDFDIYDPNVTRNYNELMSMKEEYNLYEYNNIDKIVYSPRELRRKDEQLCFPIFRAIKEKVENKKYDLICAHWVYPNGYVAYLLSQEFNIPYVITAHGHDIHTNPFMNQDTKKYREIREFTVQALNSAKQVIFVSEYLRNEAIKLEYASDNSKIIPNGIDGKLFKIVDKNSEKDKLNLNKNKKYIIYVGNIIKIKGSDLLIDIFSSLYKKNDNVEMLIIGDGDLENELVDKAKQYDLYSKVHFLGRLPHKQLYKYIGVSDVFILPSRNEGWPCVVNEAIACGVPVVGSDVGGIIEAIGGDEYGSVVKWGNDIEEFVDDFSNEILNWLTKDYNPLNLRKKALRYTWSNQCKKEIEVMGSSVRGVISE